MPLDFNRGGRGSHPIPSTLQGLGNFPPLSRHLPPLHNEGVEPDDLREGVCSRGDSPHLELCHFSVAEQKIKVPTLDVVHQLRNLLW